MSTVPDRARPATRPTNGQYVNILQSVAESHLPSKKNYDDAAFVAARTAQTFPTDDDRKHLTGDDAIAFGGNLITDTYVSWIVEGDISDGGAGVYNFDGTTGTQPIPSTASLAQALSADPTQGQEIRVSFLFEMSRGNGLRVLVKDASDEWELEAIVGGHYVEGVQGPSTHVYAFVSPRNMGISSLVILDEIGNLVGQLSNPVVAVRAQSV